MANLGTLKIFTYEKKTQDKLELHCLRQITGDDTTTIIIVIIIIMYPTICKQMLPVMVIKEILNCSSNLA